jgi:hypothetical protein
MADTFETSHYTKQAKKLLSEGDRRNIRDILSLNPRHGDIIQGAGGIRKMRYALPNTGKSGGARVIHFYKAADDIVYILDVYAKSKKGDLTKAEQNALKKLTGQL